MIYVRILEDNQINQQCWMEFVDRHPEATIDHCWQWRAILKGAFGFEPYYLGAFAENKLVGILPLFHVPRTMGRSDLVSVPFGNYGGICADNIAASDALIDEANRLVGKLNCSYAALHHKKDPVNSNKLEAVNEHARFNFPITDSAENMFKKWGTNNRKKVRVSNDAGVTIAQSKDIEPLYQIHLHKFHRLGTPCFPRSYYQLILEHFGDQAAIYYAYYQNKVIAYDLVFFFKKSLLMPLSGAYKEYFHLHPNHLLFWHEVSTAAQRGLSEVDMCRSRRDGGSSQFKRLLGMKEESLGYQYIVADKEKFSPCRSYDPKFKLAIQIWQQLPLSITKFLGPKIVRYFACIINFVIPVMEGMYGI